MSGDVTVSIKQSIGNDFSGCYFHNVSPFPFLYCQCFLKRFFSHHKTYFFELNFAHPKILAIIASPRLEPGFEIGNGNSV